MTGPARRRPALGLAVVGIACTVTVALAVAGVALAIVRPEPDQVPAGESGGLALAVFGAVVFTAFGFLGAIVVLRQPRNPVGWSLQLIALALAVLPVGDQLYFRALSGHQQVTGLGAYAAWVVTWIWILALVPAFILIPLLFPTGRPLSRPWTRVVWTALLAGAVALFGTASTPGPLFGYPAASNPLGIQSGAVHIGLLAADGVLVPTALAAIASAVIRFRRSAGVERQQLKGVAAALLLLPVGFVGGGVVDDGAGGFAFLLGGLFGVAAAVAVAMLRYRLYDIDVVINRALVYGALTATLAVAYVGGVLLLQFALRPLTDRSDLAVAGSTLAVAGLFGPARRRIRGFVDRRFYRSRYDAARTLDAFGGRLRAEVDLDALADDLRGVVRDTLAPTHVSFWLRP